MVKIAVSFLDEIENSLCFYIIQVLSKYTTEGFPFLLRAFNVPKYLEDLTGLTKLMNDTNLFEVRISQQFTQCMNNVYYRIFYYRCECFSDIFSISSLVRISMTSLTAFCIESLSIYIIKRKLHSGLKIYEFYRSISSRHRVIFSIYSTPCV